LSRWRRRRAGNGSTSARPPSCLYGTPPWCSRGSPSQGGLPALWSWILTRGCDSPSSAGTPAARCDSGPGASVSS
jgi:hypothetical protein